MSFATRPFQKIKCTFARERSPSREECAFSSPVFDFIIQPSPQHVTETGINRISVSHLGVEPQAGNKHPAIGICHAGIAEDARSLAPQVVVPTEEQLFSFPSKPTSSCTLAARGGSN